MRIGSAADLALEGGTLVSPESGARGEDVHPSYEYIPDVLDEEDRVSGRDPLRKRRLSTRRLRSPFGQITAEETRWGGPRWSKFRSDSAYWPVNSAHVEPDELADPSPFDPIDRVEALEKELESLFSED